MSRRDRDTIDWVAELTGDNGLIRPLKPRKPKAAPVVFAVHAPLLREAIRSRAAVMLQRAKP